MSYHVIRTEVQGAGFIRKRMVSIFEAFLEFIRLFRPLEHVWQLFGRRRGFVSFYFKVQVEEN